MKEARKADERRPFPVPFRRRYVGRVRGVDALLSDLHSIFAFPTSKSDFLDSDLLADKESEE